MFREQDTQTRLPAILEGRVLESRTEPGDSRTHDAAPDGAKSASRRLGLGFNRRTLIVAAAAIAIVAGGAFGTEWWLNGRYIISTDDAYVRAHNTTLASKISGYVQSIPVEDNATIRAGDVIATIDDGDYKLAADAAREKVATQQATVDRIGRQVRGAKRQYRSGQGADGFGTGCRQAHATGARPTAGACRAEIRQPADFGAGASQSRPGAAAVDNAQAVIDAASANRDVLEAQQQEAARTLDELKTALAKAERDFSFTVIRAPVDGVFSNRAVQTGDYVQTGQRIASLVPLDDVYVDANFKETQLERLKPGQPVSISVDALPDHAIAGRVESLSPASGAVFSLLPPDNATGNFTKIVQRLAVRIEVPAGVAAKQVLRPGMSVVVSVNTRPAKAATKTALAGEGAASLR